MVYTETKWKKGIRKTPHFDRLCSSYSTVCIEKVVDNQFNLFLRFKTDKPAPRGIQLKEVICGATVSGSFLHVCNCTVISVLYFCNDWGHLNLEVAVVVIWLFVVCYVERYIVLTCKVLVWSEDKALCNFFQHHTRLSSLYLKPCIILTHRQAEFLDNTNITILSCFF